MFPKGVRTRATPDWFVPYLSTVGFGNPPGNFGTPEFMAFWLYNNATTGDYLYLWGVSLILSNTDYGNVALVSGHSGALVASGIRINPLTRAPPGQLYYDHQLTNIWGITPQTTLPSFVAGPGAYNYPIFIIPPGYAMAVVSPLQTDEFQIAAWYLPMTDQNGRNPV